MKFLHTKNNSLINAEHVKEIYITGERDNTFKMIARCGGAERILREKMTQEEAEHSLYEIGCWLNDEKE